MRTAEAHRETETLVAAEHHVSTPFTWRCDESQAHQVSGDANLHAFLFPNLNTLAVVDDFTKLVRILDDDAEVFLTCAEVLDIVNDDFDSEEVSSCLDDLDCLWEHVVCHENLLDIGFHLSA